MRKREEKSSTRKQLVEFNEIAFNTSRKATSFNVASTQYTPFVIRLGHTNKHSLLHI